MKRHDRAALELALALAQYCARNPHARRKPFVEAAEHAAYCCQCAALDLKPWQIPPVWVADPDDPDAGRLSYQVGTDDGRYEAAKLLRQMLDLGISRWHPDPVAAIHAKSYSTGYVGSHIGGEEPHIQS